MKRRDLLKGLPVAALAPAGLVAMPAIGAEMTAQERYDYHLAEFKRAAEELDPMIGHWNLMEPEEPGEPIRLFAYRVTGRYQGDGIYEAGREDALGRRGEYRVELLPDTIDGHRTFRVVRGHDRSRMLEYLLETTIGRRIGGMV